MRTAIVVLGVGLCLAAVDAEVASPLAARIDRLTAEVLPRVVAWRRDFHQHPELGNREYRTSAAIAETLTELGYAVSTGVAHTGVVGVLRGGKPGPVVALRSEMDALPVTEQVDVPFKSTAVAPWDGQDVGVMHACGHDTHMAMVLGAARILALLRDDLPGSVKVIFQPAEEGPPPGEQGGAELMVKEGVLEHPTVDAIFALHVSPLRAGHIEYRSGPLNASSDSFTIRIEGRQTHAALPWSGVDPIVIGSQIVTALQTIVSRQVNITEAPAVVTVGAFNSGNRPNIVPGFAELRGTVRAFNEEVRQDIQRRIRDISTRTAEAAGASVELTMDEGYPGTVNHSALTERMVPTLVRVAGADRVRVGPLMTTTEDFAFFQQKVPGMLVSLGVTPPDQDPAKVPQNHSPWFFADESALPVGVRALAHLGADYLFSRTKRQ